MEHVLVRGLEHLGGDRSRPALGFGVEIRERPGPLHRFGAFADEPVWVQLRGGLFVARAVVRISWVGEYDDVRAVRERTRGSALHEFDDFWSHRPRFGYAGVAELARERWLEPFWAGPRSYGYEWVRLENDRKRDAWLDSKPPPRGGERLLEDFRGWLERSG